MAINLKKSKKKKALRNNEYYDFQEIQDDLYKQSKNKMNFKNLMKLITDDRNIFLAYRNIKRNKGSNTVGTNINNILNLAETEPKFLIKYVKERLIDYKPEPVRRVKIPKSGGTGTRPLGIPCTDDRNILLAYRNIKRNKGSITVGTNFSNIMNLAETEPKFLIKYVKERLIDYKPEPVRRVEIPKDGGTKTRPLGIPCIEDRFIQQCIKQILEPICEAKFHPHNYGFRPNRSTHHAISRMTFLANNSHLYYVVDIDIKGFFDNVNHGKLLKQMWTLGIQDKCLISIISKMLKAEIKGIGVPTKGTPQGGILSPLLSNIVLNELDWWISNQWETFETKYKYARRHKYRALKTTHLKEMYIVRYADDCAPRKRGKQLVRVA